MLNNNTVISMRFFIVSCILLLTAGCQKEGVYQPKKKISKVYIGFPNSPGEKKLYQTWKWDGNLLKSISFYEDEAEMQFEYKGKQLRSITSFGKYNQYYLFHYDKNGKRLDSLDVYADNLSLNPNVRHYAHYDFSHNEEGLISGYEEVVYDTGPYWYKNKDELGMVLQCAIPGLPELAAHHLAAPKSENKGDAYVMDTYSVSFSYIGNNLSECHILQNNTFDGHYKFTYTDHQNPFYKFFNFSDFSYDSYSTNLAKNCYYEELYLPDPSYDYYAEIEYEYEIEDGFPVKTTRNSTMHSFDDPSLSSSTSSIKYYEYYE